MIRDEGVPVKIHGDSAFSPGFAGGKGAGSA